MQRDEFDRLRLDEVSDLVDAWSERESRHDLRAGIIGSILANVHRDQKRAPLPFRPSDLFPSLTRYEPEPTDKDIELRFDAIAAMLGAVDTTKERAP